VSHCYSIFQKEAAWAISNATSGGNDAQIRYLAAQGVIPRLCDLFGCPDTKIIMVAMEGVENILRVGKADGAAAADGQNLNQYADVVDGCGGLDYLEALQAHENEDIYKKANSILQTYFISAEDDDQGGADAQQQPQVSEDGQQFQYSAQQGGGGGQQGGFQLGGYQ
jgi:hypothetical protein